MLFNTTSFTLPTRWTGESRETTVSPSFVPCVPFSAPQVRLSMCLWVALVVTQKWGGVMSQRHMRGQTSTGFSSKDTQQFKPHAFALPCSVVMGPKMVAKVLPHALKVSPASFLEYYWSWDGTVFSTMLVAHFVTTGVGSSGGGGGVVLVLRLQAFEGGGSTVCLSISTSFSAALWSVLRSDLVKPYVFSPR